MHRNVIFRVAATVATSVLVLALAPLSPVRADSPGTTLSVTPLKGLAASQSVSVSGSGFKPNFSTGILNQCGVAPGLDFEGCHDLGTFTTNGSGSFGPISVTVTSTFTPDDGSPDINCVNTTCTIFANTNELSAHRRITFGAPRPVADFNGNGTTDRAVYRPSTGRWFVNGGSPEATDWGIPGDVPVPADYNGDGVVDKAVYRPSSGQWFILNAPPTPTVVQYGAPCSSNCINGGDIPVPGDYNGDGRADIAVYRPSTGFWFVKDALVEGIQYGAGCGACASPADLPVPADYTGDGVVDKAVYRPSTGQWFVLDGPQGVVYGTAGDIPMPADYDNDNDADIAVYRPSTGQWFRRGVTPEIVQFGAPGACCDDVPVPGDYDGNNTTDTAVYRRSTGTWFVLGGSPASLVYGAAGDIPVVLPYHLRIRAGLTG